MAEQRRNTPVAPLKESLTVCPVCGQIYDAHHMGAAFHHRHADGDETPLPPSADGVD